MRISVVINTYNRAPSLRQTLCSLRHQTFRDFEVVVVNGPSTDTTESVLAEFAGAVRAGRCDEAHLSRSRNVGIGLAAGEVVAFLDDDALPEPTWLQDLSAAYDGPGVGGAGGLVFDHTGFRLQYRFACCDRLGAPLFRVAPPFDRWNAPGADPFIYLQGTNCSFRRDALAAIGGFDEEIEYHLDEVEVCLQLIDRRYRLRPLDGAAVHHKYLASHVRGGSRVILNPYPIIKNRAYFALRHGRRNRSVREVLRSVEGYAVELRDLCAMHTDAGRMSAAQRDHFMKQLAKGLEDGRQRGLGGERRGRNLPPPPDAFSPFPVLSPAGRRLTVCLAFLGKRGSPPAEAVELAGRGHEVHAVGVTEGSNRVDLEDGVWLRRLAPPLRHIPALEGSEAKEGLCRAAAVYQEIRRIRTRKPLDAVAIPCGASDSLVITLDDDLETVLIEDVPGAWERLLTSAATAEIEGAGAGDRSPRRDGPAKAVLDRLAEKVSAGTRLGTTEAAQAATALLAPDCFPSDCLAELLALPSLSDGQFLERVYQILLGRDLDPAGSRHFGKLLRGGLSRREVVAHLAGTREAAGQPHSAMAAVQVLMRCAPTWGKLSERSPDARRLRDRWRVAVTRFVWAIKARLRRKPAEPARTALARAAG